MSEKEIWKTIKEIQKFLDDDPGYSTEKLAKNIYRYHIQDYEQREKVLVEAIKYALRGMSHSDSKAECRHCHLKEVLGKYRGLKE